MKPFELRLALEHSKLDRHCRNLENFINDPSRFSRLSPVHQDLLQKQLFHMQNYLLTLKERMRLLNIPV